MSHEITASAQQSRKPQAALILSRSLVDATGGNAKALSAYINLCIEFELKDEAQAALRQLVSKHLDEGQHRMAADLLEKMQRLGYDAGNLHKRIRTGATKARKRRGIKRICAAAAILVIVGYQAWTLMAWSDLQSAHGLSVYTFDGPAVDQKTVVGSLSPVDRRAVVETDSPSERRYRQLESQYAAFFRPARPQCVFTRRTQTPRVGQPVR